MGALEKLIDQVIAADMNGDLSENITAYPEAAAELESLRKETMNDTMNDTEKALNYYKAGFFQGIRGASHVDRRPDYVPQTIKIIRTVRGESFSGPRLIAKPGVYICKSNQFGAISVLLDNGELGIKPGEFEVIDWTENPHKQSSDNTN